MSLRKQTPTVEHSSNKGITLLEFLVVLAIIGILIVMLLPAVRSPRGAARRTQCKNHLKQIGLALHNYYDVYGAFPPAFVADENGRKLHSWRVLILPYLDQAPLYETIDLSKPWDDPVNADAYNADLFVYRCPSADVPSTHTTYLALVGEDLAFHPTQSRQMKEFLDGTSNTAMVAEFAASEAVHWMAPTDADLDMFLQSGQPEQLNHQGGGHILYADGAIRWFANDFPIETRKATATLAGQDGLSCGVE